MYYLYGLKPGAPPRLVATFDSQQQLQSYVRWATLSEQQGVHKFEQGSPLVGYTGWSSSDVPPESGGEAEVLHNPSPSML